MPAACQGCMPQGCMPWHTQPSRLQPAGRRAHARPVWMQVTLLSSSLRALVWRPPGGSGARQLQQAARSAAYRMRGASCEEDRRA